MFSQKVEYALRAAVHLAQRQPRPQTAEQIARATLVPAAYLSKVLQQMVQGHVVRSQRGIGGGFLLVKSPDTLSLLEVVNAVDPLRRIETCPLGLEAHGIRLCPLHRRLDEALGQVEDAFRNTTLAEVLAEPTSSVPLCAFPRSLGIVVAGKPGPDLAD